MNPSAGLLEKSQRGNAKTDEQSYLRLSLRPHCNVIGRGIPHFLERILVPWFEERVYKDAQIEGKWFSLYPTTEEHRQETISLTRHGHAVTGTMICTAGFDEGEQYQLSGSFRNLILRWFTKLKANPFMCTSVSVCSFTGI
jgi:hypothetical protein